MPTGYFAATDWGLERGTIPGPTVSEMLYEFSSASANNGSEFGGLTTAWGSYDDKNPNPPVPQNPAWDIATGLVMLLGRFLPVIAPMLPWPPAWPGRSRRPLRSGRCGPTPLPFGCVLLGTIILIGALLFLPVAALGPVAEHFGPLPFGG